MSDGTLSVRRRQPKATKAQGEQVNSSDIFTDIPGDLRPPRSQVKRDAGELRMITQPVKKLKEYDKLLKAFKYSAALDTVLKKVLILSMIAGFF
jgi:U3 small nucleolar RNA-associated protein 15